MITGVDMRITGKGLLIKYAAAVFAAIPAAFQPVTVYAARVSPAGAGGRGPDLISILIIAILVLLCILCLLIAVLYLSSEKREGKSHKLFGKGRKNPKSADREYPGSPGCGRGTEETTDYEYDENEEYDWDIEYDEEMGYDEDVVYGEAEDPEVCGYPENAEYTEYTECTEYDEGAFCEGELEYISEQTAEGKVRCGKRWRLPGKLKAWGRNRQPDDIVESGAGKYFEPEEDIVSDVESNAEGSMESDIESNTKEAFCMEEAAPEEDYSVPIIKVDRVTMKFKVAVGSTSGLKDYVIQRLKKQIFTRDLLALDNVSFDVFKGEVVGIIGTNGSGKSTLLKIVSGAMQPTEGRVIVDKSKIQLLTLGTGFDMELSARENVFLNGAIIGYSKEFITEHFDEIVAFAELEGFMDTKVKNFSSGMVSRLGFAVATAGDAAEILILDEVLSVGDEFFRKKSLKRIKEMIHGGSTVIMVSHAMGTIRENCTKVIWIEKGILQMAGDAKTVCRAYQRMESR